MPWTSWLLSLIVFTAVALAAAATGHLTGRVVAVLPLIVLSVYMSNLKWAAIRRNARQRRE